MHRLHRWSTLPLLLLLASCGTDAPGVITPEPGSASLSAANKPDNAVLRVLNVQLTAEAEVPHTSTSRAKGHAQIKIHPGGRITWKGRINNIARENFTMGHIHVIANANRTGPPLLFLFDARQPNPPGWDDSRHIDFAGESTSHAALAEALLANPSNYYVNFHTTAFPPGAIRGDL
jgi:hypothetical protein